MRFGELKSIGHNIADSLASGLGFPIGCYGTEIFEEAAGSECGFICVDFLTGTSAGGPASSGLARAIELYRQALIDLCERHGAEVSAFNELTVRYSLHAVHGPHFVVTIEDAKGRRSIEEYHGFSGKRLRSHHHA